MYQSISNANIRVRSIKDADAILVRPFWKYVQIQTNQDYTAVEFMLSAENNFNYIMPESASRFKQSGDKRYKLSKTNFVYTINHKTDEENMFLMTIVPSLDYLEQTNFKPFKKMSYLVRDKNFKGIIFFHDMNGDFINGWKYNNGEVTASIYAHLEKNEFSIADTRSSCTDYYLEYLVEECTSWGLPNGEITGQDCIYYTEWRYWYTACSGSGSGNAGGGGGYSGIAGNNKSKSIALKIVANDHLNNAGKEELINVIDEMNDHCAYRYLFSNKNTNKLIYSLQYDSNASLGYFEPKDNIIYFKDNSTIANSFEEEFIHAYQDYWYDDGTDIGIQQYSDAGKPNIEFEAHLLKDLVCRFGNMGCPYWGAGKYHSEYYERWLENLVAKGLENNLTFQDIMTYKYNGFGYWELMEDFKKKDSKYDKEILPNLHPQVIKELFRYIISTDCN